MRAFQITEPKSTRIVDIKTPSLGSGDVLLKIRTIGMCGSDLSSYLGKNSLLTFPRIPGHEIAATIVERGSEVPESFNVGMNVTVVPYTSCGVCSSCLRGRTNACKNNETLGVQRDGALTEYITVPWQKVVPPEGLALEELVLVEPLTVGFHAVDRSQVRDDDTVLVIGCGMIGLGAIVRANLRGARVIATDIDDEKLAIAASFGAHVGINSRSVDLSRELDRVTDGHGPDVVIEAVGSPATYRTAVEVVAFTGRVTGIGYAAEDAPIPTRLIVQKELDLRGSRNATAQDFRAVVRFLGRRTLPLEQVISRRVPLEHSGEALRDWAADPPHFTKILVTVSE
ncbi:MAG TPA: zinc-binding alcohol dehydrogenase family protein [Spirochaetia bacterium]|nr:zinc-binding alcohol dehydrogenase family protein [Spirochaetia bacterium]